MNVMVSFVEHTCLECGYFCINRRSLGNHISRSHKNTMPEGIKNYVMKHFLKNTIPLCKCGCGKEVAWHNSCYTFNDFVIGHNVTFQKKFLKENKKPKVINKKQIPQPHKNYIAFNPKTSESEFVQYCVNTFSEEVEINKILNINDKTYLFECYFPNINLYVKFDNIKHHGFDRDSEWEISQIENIANDIEVNELAKNGIINLIRIKNNITLYNVKNINDLYEYSYHYVADGTIHKEGTFKLQSEKQIIFSKEQIITINEQAYFPESPGRQYTENFVIPLFFKFWRVYVTYWGWFYPTENNEVIEEVVGKLNIRKIPSAVEEINLNGIIGNSWLKANFTSFWNVQEGPAQSFWNDKHLLSVLKYRFGINNSIDYDYHLKNGRKISCKETFDINIKNIRFGFIVQRKSVSFFKPTTACDIYKFFLEKIGSTKEPKVFDPSCGFGARLLGFAGAFVAGEYWGCEPASQTFDDLEKLKKILNEKYGNLTINIFKQGSEDVRLPNGYFDFSFTSPPYFDKEKYFDEDGQCWRQYNNIVDWKNNYLYQTYKNVYDSLRVGGMMAINFDDTCTPHSREVAIRAGFKVHSTFNLKLSSDHFKKKATGKNIQYEVVDVFIK